MWRAAALVGAGLLGLAVAGCSSPAAAHPTTNDAAVHATSALGTSSPRVGPDQLAPAGPAPGRESEENDGHDDPATSAIARSIGCVDPEMQAHLPSVDAQMTCRRGTEQAYILTFRSPADRDTYLTHGPQVVPGGFDVVGPTWAVHVEARATANTLAAQLHGAVHPAA